MSDLDWDDLRLFSTLAHAGSVRRAGKQLDVHASTVARRLQHLEDRLRVRLFNRNPNGLALTDAGHEALDRVDRWAEEIATLEQDLSGRDDEIGGRLRVSIPALIRTAIVAIGGDFATAYPEVELVLRVDDGEKPDPGRAEVDVAIRITDEPPEHLLGRLVGRVGFAAFASADYLEGVDVARAPSSAVWVADDPVTDAESLIKRLDFANVPARVHCADPDTKLDAFRDGIGIGVLPEVVGSGTEDLVAVSARDYGEKTGLWLLAHSDHRGVARVQRFMQFVADACATVENLAPAQR